MIDRIGHPIPADRGKRWVVAWKVKITSDNQVFLLSICGLKKADDIRKMYRLGSTRGNAPPFLW